MALFQEITPTIELAKYRGLQLLDPRIVTQYHDVLKDQLAYHKIPGKVEQLLADSKTNPQNRDIPLQFEKTDKLLTECMLHAERTSSKKFSTRYQWSPALSSSVNAVRYWRLRLRQAKGIPISTHTLQKQMKAANIETDTTLDTPAIVKKLREALATLRDHQKQHIELRQSHLESLAEARVDHALPDLIHHPDK